MLLAILTVLFGSPRAILASRVLGALAMLCPCAPADVACPARHELVAGVVATVALEADDPERAAVLLLAAGAHETRFATMRQVGGEARSWFQVEPLGKTRAERASVAAHLEQDPLFAARRALRIAGTCGGSMRGYATGSCSGGGETGAKVAAELRRYVVAARWALAVQ